MKYITRIYNDYLSDKDNLVVIKSCSDIKLTYRNKSPLSPALNINDMPE